MAEKKNGIFLYNELIEAVKEGEINKDEFFQLVDLLYQAVNNGVYAEVSDIENTKVRSMWRLLRHSAKKSARNSRYYNNRQEKQSSSNDQKDFITRVKEECKVEYDYIVKNIGDKTKTEILSNTRKSIINKLKATEEEAREFDKHIFLSLQKKSA